MSSQIERNMLEHGFSVHDPLWAAEREYTENDRDQLQLVHKCKYNNLLNSASVAVSGRQDWSQTHSPLGASIFSQAFVEEAAQLTTKSVPHGRCCKAAKW